MECIWRDVVVTKPTKLISRDCKINRRVQDLVVLADYEAKTCMVMDKHQFSY